MLLRQRSHVRIVSGAPGVWRGGMGLPARVDDKGP